MARPKHSLQINLIDKFAKEFIENKGYECLIEEHPNKTITEKHITIFKDKVKGSLFYIFLVGKYHIRFKLGIKTLELLARNAGNIFLSIRNFQK
jgi:hypothetical protein